jgi:hypothetical protein
MLNTNTNLLSILDVAMQKTKKVAWSRTRWTHREKRGIFILGLLLAFGIAGLVVMSG